MPDSKIIHTRNPRLDPRQQQDRQALIEKYNVRIHASERFVDRLKLRLKKYFLLLDISVFQNLY